MDESAIEKGMGYEGRGGLTLEGFDPVADNDLNCNSERIRHLDSSGLQGA
ncbi:MAG: hypothetical protein JRE24_06725 [Deltaproteobacteria bacterium]|nr:hypothetical protein [Deltaproteobacteria bacterium]